MADDRRPARGARPRGHTGPGRAPGAGRAGRPRPAAELPTRSTGGPRPGQPGRPGPQRPETGRLRPTSRLAILVAVFALLAVGAAASLRPYLQQRSEREALRQEILERQDRIDDLAREKRRWEDPAFVVQEARKRLGYVMPGEKAYVALDGDGNPIEPGSTLSDPSEVDPQEPEAWWSDAWGSVELAGDPPPAGDPVPLKELDGSEEQDQ